MKKIIGVVIMLVAMSGAAFATPGAVDKKGCHGKNGKQGYHCHPASELSAFKNGRRYVQYGAEG